SLFFLRCSPSHLDLHSFPTRRSSDLSRFWPADRYAPGRSQPSFDKQPLRDYLAGLKQDGQWDGNAPPPPLPREVVEATSERYLEAYKRITGRPLELG